VPVLDTDEQNLLLDCRYGPSRSTLVTDDYEFELWSGDPRDADDDSHEVSGGGYAAVAWDMDDFGPADGGSTSTTSEVEFALSGALDDDDSVTHWLLRNATTGDRAFSGPLSDEIVPLGAGTVAFTATIPFADPEA
jgi:hypothetical protein